MRLTSRLLRPLMDSLALTDGVFAVNKPFGLTSAQVLRDLQKTFGPSAYFKSAIDAEQQRRDQESHNQRQKRSRRSRGKIQVKLGHGGTLDPAATGVLIVGVGKGTKSLSSFLGCKKSYEAVITFGVATDSYDGQGKIIKRAPASSWEDLTKEKVSEALNKLAKETKQIPPIFSALHVDGKRMYEYAREGKDIPKLEPRDVVIDRLELVEWLPGGQHSYNWPTAEAEKVEQETVDKILGLEEQVGHEEEDSTISLKRRRPDETVNGTVTDTEDGEPVPKLPKMQSGTEVAMSGALQQKPVKEEQKEDTKDIKPTIEESQAPCPAPAVRVSMTVSSGFYVRSLAHDLGLALGTVSFMSALVRSQQERFELGKNVLEWEDLNKDEKVWAPKIQRALSEWADEEKARAEEDSD